MKDHEKRFLDRLRGVREACNALDNNATRFEGAVRNAWGTMDKSASEYGTRMAQAIEEAAGGLGRQQTPVGYEDTERFHKESIEVLNKIIKIVRRYVPKLRRGLRVEMAALNVALGKLEVAVRSLGQALDQSPGNKIEAIRRDIVHLQQVHEELLKLKTEEIEAKEALKEIEVKEDKILASSQEFSSNDMFLELNRYEGTLRAKEDEIKQFLQPIIKPLTKLERIEADRKNQTLDLMTLHGLVERPVETVSTGQPFAMAQLLNQLGAALTRGDLEIEERRRRKAEETVQQVKQGAIEKLREDYLTIQANVQETLRQLKATGLLDKKNEVDQRKATILNDREHLTSQVTELRRRIEAVNKTLAREAQSIRQQITQVTGKDLQILIEQ